MKGKGAEHFIPEKCLGVNLIKDKVWKNIMFYKIGLCWVMQPV
jgi:hypothetical protein